MPKILVEDLNNIKTNIGVNKHEQETAIYFTRDDTMCTLSTTDCVFINKMKRITERNPEAYKCFANMNNRNEVDSYMFEFPIKCLSFRSGKKKSGRVISEEEKKKIAERFAKNRKEKT